MISQCPTCKKPSSIEPDNQFRPFCSERCQLIDFGEWIEEKYSVPAQDSAGINDSLIESDSKTKH